MSRPWRERAFTVRYLTPPDEAVLLVHRTQRRQAISLASGKPRSIYGQISKPFSDDVVVGMYRLHREERIPPVDIIALGRFTWEMPNAIHFSGIQNPNQW